MAQVRDGLRLPVVEPERLRDAVRAVLAEQGGGRSVSGTSARAMTARLPSLGQLVSSAAEVLRAQEADEPAAEYFVSLLELGYLVASADGLAPEEREALALLLEQAMGQTVRREALELHFADLDATVAALGRHERLLRAAASFSTEEARGEALGFAALVAMADGRLEPSELAVLRQLGEALGFGGEAVEAVVAVVARRIEDHLQG